LHSDQYSLKTIEVENNHREEYWKGLPWNGRCAGAFRIKALVRISIRSCGSLALDTCQIGPLFVWNQFLYLCYDSVSVTLLKRKFLKMQPNGMRTAKNKFLMRVRTCFYFMGIVDARKVSDSRILRPAALLLTYPVWLANSSAKAAFQGSKSDVY